MVQVLQAVLELSDKMEELNNEMDGNLWRTT